MPLGKNLKKRKYCQLHSKDIELNQTFGNYSNYAMWEPFLF